MLANLKRILLTQYIGAIITAYLAVQGLLGIVTLIAYFFTWFFVEKQAGVFGAVSRPPLAWDRLIQQFVGALIQLLVATGFLVWLYRQSPIDATPDEPEDLAEESA